MTTEIPPGLKDGIDPGVIVIPQVKVEKLEEAARAIKGDGQDVADAGSDITSAWGGLQGLYTAPEDDALFSAIDPVATKGDDIHTAADTVGDALLVFAEDVRPILQRWRGLKHDARDMQDHIDANEEWDKDEDKVDELSRLNNDLIKVQNDFMAAERECANKITALVEGGTTFVATDPGSQPSAGKGEKAYGYSEAPEDVATPWAVPQEHDAAWYVDVGSAISDLTWGSVKDMAAMAGYYGGDGDWTMDDALRREYAGEYWTSTAKGLATLTGIYGEDGWGGGSLGETAAAWESVGQSIVPWDEWGDRPGYVLTTSVVNIGSMAAGAVLTATGVGAAAGVPLLAWRGSRVLRTIGNIGDAVPGSHSGSGSGLPGGSGSGGSGPKWDFDLKLEGVGDRNGPPTTQDIQNRLGDWEDTAAEIGWEETMQRAADLSELAEQRQPVSVGAPNETPGIQANAEGPNDPPSTDPKPGPPPTDSPTFGPPPERPSSPSPDPSGEGGSPGGGSPPTGGGGGDSPFDPNAGGPEDGERPAGDQQPIGADEQPDPVTPEEHGEDSPEPQDDDPAGADEPSEVNALRPDQPDSGTTGEDGTGSTEEVKSRRSPPDWVIANRERGNEFNAQREPIYTARGGANEVHVGELTPGKQYHRLDSYIPGKEIVSRKHTQLSEVQVETGIKYLNNLKDEYSPGTVIADVPSNRRDLDPSLIGTPLKGDMILEIPVQNADVPKEVLTRAEDLNITIRDEEGTVYELPDEEE